MARPALTQTRIVSAGIAVVSELGMPALNLKAVAWRLHVTATGVQRVISATELMRSVVAEITVTMPPVPTGGLWSKRLRVWALETRAWLAEYPGLAGYLLANRWEVPVAVDRLEEVVEVLEVADLTAEQRVAAGLAFFRFVLSSTGADESTRVISGERSAPPDPDPAGRWPRMAGHVGDCSAAFAEAQFAAGLDLLLRGVSDRVEA